MNNYHIFLIRPDYVTQLAAHLLAGIVALALVTGFVMPKAGQLSAPAESVSVVAVAPAHLTVVARN